MLTTSLVRTVSTFIQPPHSRLSRAHRKALTRINTGARALAKTASMSRRTAAALPQWVVEQWPDAVMLTNTDGTIEYVNAAFEKLTGYRRAEVLGRSPSVMKSGRQDRRFYARLWGAIRKGKPFRGVFLNRRKNGELFYEEEVILPLRGADRRIAFFLSAGRDITARVREREVLEHAATHDALTELPNRRLYLDRLEQALRQAARRKEPFTVAIMDLDGFKQANTRHGHLAGDAVLRAVAERTKHCLRAVDTIARIGGDEFALILPEVDERGAATVLEKVRKANCAALRYGRSRIGVSMSIGAALYPAHGRQAMRLFRRADAAMYLAKRSGGNRCRFV